MSFISHARRRLFPIKSRLRDSTIHSSTWTTQYQEGRWEYLWSSEQLPRYGVLAAYLQNHRPNPRILDLGCGEGILCSRLAADCYEEYVGIDVCSEAIQRATQRQLARSTFICADMDQFVLGESTTFDSLVFNEVLYYLKDPLATIDGYCRFLRPGGLILTSVFEPQMSSMKRVMHAIASRSQWNDEVVVTHSESRKTWIITAFVV